MTIATVYYYIFQFGYMHNYILRCEAVKLFIVVLRKVKKAVLDKNLDKCIFKL